MNIQKTLLILGLSSTLLIAAQPNQQKQHNMQLKKVIQTGKQTTKLLLHTLGSQMKKKMKAGGPMEALDFCSQEAFTLTDSVNKKLDKGVSVKRVSLKYRSAANAPTADETQMLQTLEQLNKQHVVAPNFFVQQVQPNVYKFYKPLVIKKKVCLKCHGDIANEKLKDAIAQRYPQDKALHYKMGDLRGAVVVTITTDNNTTKKAK